jgi:hypothetical protein
MRGELAERLRTRSAQIETAILARIKDVGEPISDEDAAYLAGLKSAMKAILDYAFECIERGAEPGEPLPLEVARQARRAARDGVRLDTILRRCAVGNNLLEGFIVSEWSSAPVEVLREVLNAQGPQVDRVMELVIAEYRDELGQLERSAAQRQDERVLRLLADDDLAGPDGLDYDFDAWHVGMILIGGNPAVTGRLLAERLGCASLQVARDEETAWVWLGAKQGPTRDLARFLVENTPAGVSVATGEPRRGLGGWRLTHREAQVALQVMLRRPRKVMRGKDVVLLAGVLRDETLVRSLLDNYLAPLEGDGDSGRAIFDTLRAYISSGGNAAATAASVGITRQTVQRRIRRAEECIGQPLHSCQAALEVALQIEELERLQGY